MNRVWNSENQNQVVNYLNALNYLYVGYVNNVISNIPRYSVVEGGANATSTNPPAPPVESSVAPPDINGPVSDEGSEDDK